MSRADRLRDLVLMAMEQDEPFVFVKLCKNAKGDEAGHIVLSSADRFTAQKLINIATEHLRESTRFHEPIPRWPFRSGGAS